MLNLRLVEHDTEVLFPLCSDGYFMKGLLCKNCIRWVLASENLALATLSITKNTQLVAEAMRGQSALAGPSPDTS